MNQFRPSRLPYIAVVFALGACQAGVTPAARSAAPPAAVAPAVSPAATPTARPLGDHVIAEWTVQNPSGVFTGFGSVWIPGHHDRSTTRIDPTTNAVTAVIQGTGDHAEQALVVGSVFWVTGQQNDTTWIDPATNTVTTTMPRVPGHLHYLANGFNSVWITTDGNKVLRVDPATGKIVATISYAEGYADCQGFVDATSTAIWVEDCDRLQLTKIDPATNAVVSKTAYATLIKQAKARTTIPAGSGRDSLWICIAADQLKGGDGNTTGLIQIDPNTLAGLTFLSLTPDQAGGGFVDITDKSVWLGGFSQINRVNVATNRIDGTYRTDPGTTIQVRAGFGSVWLENYDRNLVQLLDVAP